MANTRNLLNAALFWLSFDAYPSVFLKNFCTTITAKHGYCFWIKIRIWVHYFCLGSNTIIPSAMDTRFINLILNLVHITVFRVKNEHTEGLWRTCAKYFFHVLTSKEKKDIVEPIVWLVQWKVVNTIALLHERDWNILVYMLNHILNLHSTRYMMAMGCVSNLIIES